MSKPGWRERSRENRTRKRLLEVLNRAIDKIDPLLDSENPHIRLQAACWGWSLASNPCSGGKGNPSRVPLTRPRPRNRG